MDSSRCSRAPHVALTVNRARAYGQALLQGVADYVEAYGPWSIYLEPSATGTLPPNWLRRWRGDGILAYAGSARVVKRLVRSGIPCVELYSIVEQGPLPRVGSDDHAIGRMAAEHLLERALKRFAYCGYEGLNWSQERCRAFAAAVAQAGFPCHGHLELPGKRIPSTWERSQQDLADWLAALSKPVGLMAANDDYAQRVLDACRRARVAVPEDVAVIGAENDEDLCRLCDPSLSSVAVNARQIGYEGARLLAQLMAGEVRPGEVEPRRVPPLGVVARRSTDVMAIENREVAEAVSFIRRRACDRIQAGDVAEAICRSRATLYRLFEETLGRSPRQEILRVQLERARTLLAQTSDTLEEIARRSGFNDASYFSVVFKREIGMTAGEYRVQHRNA